MLRTALTFNIFHAIHLFMGYFQFLKNPTIKTSLSAKTEKDSFICMRIKNHFLSIADCKTVRISAYSSKRAVKQKVCNEGENRERDWGASRAYEARAFRARKTLTPRFTNFFTDFEKKTRVFCSLCQ